MIGHDYLKRRCSLATLPHSGVDRLTVRTQFAYADDLTWKERQRPAGLRIRRGWGSSLGCNSAATL